MWFYARFGGFKDFVNTATISHLTGEKLKALSIPTPPITLQKHFSEIVQNIESQKAKAEANLQKSEALFNALLQRAFRGELFVEGKECEETAAGPVTAGAAQLNLF